MFYRAATAAAGALPSQPSSLKLSLLPPAPAPARLPSALGSRPQHQFRGEGPGYHPACGEPTAHAWPVL